MRAGSCLQHRGENMLMKHAKFMDLDCSAPPPVPHKYRNDVVPLNHVPRGVIRFDPSCLRVKKIRPREHLRVEREVSGDCMITSAIGSRAITAHMHAFYMENPDCVPGRCRGYIVHSPGTLFLGYKSTVYVLGFYFVDSRIREDLFLVTGEITDVSWEDYQVIGRHRAMSPLQKPW
jgi:hypothetical protein